MGRQPNTTDVPERSGSVQGLEENLKKAVSEMLVLFLLNEREMYIGEIPDELERRSDGKFHIVFPYSVIYRMVKFEYIDELKNAWHRMQSAPVLRHHAKRQTSIWCG